MASFDLPDSYHQRIAGVGLTRSRLVNQADQMGRHRDRIDGIVGTCTVAPAAANFDREILTESRLRTGCQPKLARCGGGIHMEGDDGGNVIERSALNHLPCTVTDLLRRLEDPPPAHRSRTGGFQCEQSSQQNRGMGIMTAGVHHPELRER